MIFFFAVLKKIALNDKSGKETHFKNYSKSHFRSNRVLLIIFILSIAIVIVIILIFYIVFFIYPQN